MMFLQVHLSLQIQILNLTLPPHQNQMAVTTERGRSIHKEAKRKAIKNHTTKSHTTADPGPGPGHGHHHKKADLRGHDQIRHHLYLSQRNLL